LLREAGLVAGKDIRIELRARVLVFQIVPFGVVVILLFAFALDPDRGQLGRVAPGLFWVAVLLATLLAVSRASAVEAANGARDGLRLSCLDPGGIFLGKAAAIAVELLALEAVLTAAIAVLYDIDLAGAPLLVVAALGATASLAATGTLAGALTAGLRARETLVPVLLLPVVVPVMLGATRAWEAALDNTPSEGWPWAALLGLFAVLYAAVGMLAYGPLLED